MVEDEDPDNSYTFTLYGPYNEDISDYDSPSFYVEGDSLRSSVVFAREVADTCYVLVELEDSHGFLLSRAFTIKIETDQAGSTAVIPVSVESDLVFPNPASHLIRLKKPDQISSFEVYEISTGRMLMRKSTVEESVDVSDLADGGYLIVIQSNGSVLTQKLLIRH